MTQFRQHMTTAWQVWWERHWAKMHLQCHRCGCRYPRCSWVGVAMSGVVTLMWPVCSCPVFNPGTCITHNFLYCSCVISAESIMVDNRQKDKCSQLLLVRTHSFFRICPKIEYSAKVNIHLVDPEFKNWIGINNCIILVVLFVCFNKRVILSVHLVCFCDHYVQQVDNGSVSCTFYSQADQNCTWNSYVGQINE